MNKHRMNIKLNKHFPANRTLAGKNRLRRIHLIDYVRAHILHQMDVDNRRLNDIIWGTTREKGFLEEGC